jgi:Zn-dependent protease with chaperone function
MGQPDLRGGCGEMAALSIIAPDLMATVATLFATHPPLPVRLETLAELEAELPAGV